MCEDLCFGGNNLEIKKDFTDTHNTEQHMFKTHRNETDKDL